MRTRNGARQAGTPQSATATAFGNGRRRLRTSRTSTLQGRLVHAHAVQRAAFVDDIGTVETEDFAVGKAVA